MISDGSLVIANDKHTETIALDACFAVSTYLVYNILMMFLSHSLSLNTM